METTFDMSKKTTDRNFDSIAAKFQQNIYQTSKGRLRQLVLQRDLAELPVVATPTRILDIGAGQGQLALWLAAMGHQVHLTDVSAEMLQMAQLASAQAGVSERVSFANQALQDIAPEQGQYPLVLCHAVLEWLADPAAAIAKLWALTEPGGVQRKALSYSAKPACVVSMIICEIALSKKQNSINCWKLNYATTAPSLMPL